MRSFQLLLLYCVSKKFVCCQPHGGNNHNGNNATPSTPVMTIALPYEDWWALQQDKKAFHQNWREVHDKNINLTRENIALRYDLEDKNKKIRNLKNELAVNAVRAQIELLELLFELYMNIDINLHGASPSHSYSTSMPLTGRGVREHTKLWAEFFAGCTHPDFHRLKASVIRPIQGEPEEERRKNEEGRVKNFLLGIETTFLFSNHEMHVDKGEFTVLEIKSALKEKGYKEILNIIDPLYLIDANDDFSAKSK